MAQKQLRMAKGAGGVLGEVPSFHIILLMWQHRRAAKKKESPKREKEN